MAIEKRISLTIDTSSATAQIKKLQDAMSGVETTASKTKTGDTYTGATTGAKTARKALIDYTGSLSNADRALLSSVSTRTKLQKATLDNDTAIRKLKKANDDEILSSAQLESALRVQEEKHTSVINAINSEIAKTNELNKAKSESATTTKAVSASYKDFEGVLSDTDRRLIEIVGAQTTAEKATLAYDKQVRLLNKSLSDGEIDAKAHAKGVDSAKTAYKNTIASSEKLSDTTVTQSKNLLSYNGTLSNADRLAIQYSSTLTLLEKVTLENDTAVRRLNKDYESGVIDLTTYNSALAQTKTRFGETVTNLNNTTTATGKATSGFKIMRGGLSQLSYQLQDVTVQAQMGTSWFTIIGQQGPQIASIAGAYGAVLGIVIAVGAALGGVLYKSLNITTDATKDLEDALSKLDGQFTKTESGAYSLSGAFYELRDSSSAAGALRLSLNELNTSNAIEALSKKIEQNTNQISQSFFGLIDDVSINDYISSMETLADATDNELAAASSVVSTFGTTTATRFGRIAEASKVVRETQEDLAKQFGLTSTQAKLLLTALNDASVNQTTESYDKLDGIMFDLLKTIEDSNKRKVFGKFASGMQETTEEGRRLNEQAELLKNGPFGELTQVVSTQSASLATLKADYNDVAALTLELANRQKTLADYGKATGASVDFLNAILRSDTIRILGDAIKEQDTYNERLELYNGITKSGIQLTSDQEKELSKLVGVPNQIAAGYREYAEARAAANKADETALSYGKSMEDNLSALQKIAGQGAQDYADSVATIGEELQGLVTSTFSSMEDALVEWAETGKASFSDFVNSALSDLLRLIVRQQLAGIATGISTSFGTGTGTTDSSGFIGVGTNAKGNVITPSTYAKGGVTGMANTIQSTPKYFANGGGLLGEAGSEAIIPLTRTSGGDLGVKMTGSGGSSTVINYNVTNESGIESTQSQSTNEDGSIDINVINKLVSKSIASGYADKAITTRFNTSKRGK